MSKDPMQTIQKLIAERYADAKVVFWAGSVSKNQGTISSDLDLVIIYEKLLHAYREAFVYEGWPIDAFVHDPETLAYFCENIDMPSFAPSLPSMIADGIQIPTETTLGNHLAQNARKLLSSSPEINNESLNSRRFLITDTIDDLKDARNPHEKLATTFALYEKLAAFYLLANKQWIGSGKQLARKLEVFNPDVANQFSLAFANPQDAENIIKFSKQILEPYGGLLWDGYRSDAPRKFRKAIEL